MLVALTLLAMALIIALLNRGIFNPISITLALLALSSGLASLHLYGLYEYDPIATTIIIVGGVSVFFGSLLTLAVGAKRQQGVVVADDQDGLVRYGRLNLALALSIAILLVTRWQQLELLASGGSLADVRNAFLGYGGSDAAVDLVDRVFVGPVVTVALPVFLWSLLRRKATPSFVILFVAAGALNQVTSGGRFIFLYAGVMILALLAKSGNLHLRTARARIILAFLALGVAVFTLARGNELFFEAYTYFAIPVPLLAHWAADVESTGILTLGASFFYGGLTLLFRLSEILGMPLGAGVSAAVALPQDYWVELLPDRPFNAFVTMFYYFFLDFRWVGVVLGGFAWGALGQWSYGRTWNSGLRATLFGLLMLQVAMMSFVRWEFTNGSLVIALFMLPLFVRPDRANRVTIDGNSRRQSHVGVGGGIAS